jgi:hypothetical protein
MDVMALMDAPFPLGRILLDLIHRWSRAKVVPQNLHTYCEKILAFLSVDNSCQLGKTGTTSTRKRLHHTINLME